MPNILIGPKVKKAVSLHHYAFVNLLYLYNPHTSKKSFVSFVIIPLDSFDIKGSLKEYIVIDSFVISSLDFFVSL